MIPLLFGLGTAVLAMVGTNTGAGNIEHRICLCVLGSDAIGRDLAKRQTIVPWGRVPEPHNPIGRLSKQAGFYIAAPTVWVDQLE